jgi:hypothetical protein
LYFIYDFFIEQMSVYLPTTFIPTSFQGDVVIEPGLDLEFGYGDLNVTRNTIINGATSSFNASTGALYLPYGGLSIANSTNASSVTQGGSVTIAGGLAAARDVYLGEDLYVVGHSFLNETTVNTNDGPMTVNGQHGLHMAVKDPSEIMVSQGSLTLSTSQSNIVLDSKAPQDTAIHLKSDTPGGGTKIDTHSGGFSANTFLGAISLNAQFKASNFTVKSSNDEQNLTVSIEGNTNSSLQLFTEGYGRLTDGVRVTQAIELRTLSLIGNILMANAQDGEGSINIHTGQGGFETRTPTASGTRMINGQAGLQVFNSSGSMVLTTNNASTRLINNSTQNNQNISLVLTGATNSKIELLSSNNTEITSANTTSISSTNNMVSSSNDTTITSGNNTTVVSTRRTFIEASSTKSSEGVRIATRNNEQVVLGNKVGVFDKFPIVNFRAGSQDSHGGLAVKRYQTVSSNSSGGDVVGDGGNPVVFGTLTGGTTTSIVTSTPLDTNVTGAWIRVRNPNNGEYQVRRIKSVSGNTLFIYNTADHVNDPQEPRDGLNFSVTPQNGWNFEIYSCNFPSAFWNESQKRWSFGCSAVPGSFNFDNVSLLDVAARGLYVTSINDGTAERIYTVSLQDNSGELKYIPVPNEFGVYFLMIKPKNNPLRPYAIFMVGRGSQSSVGSVTRMISVKGAARSQLDLVWSENSDTPDSKYPGIRYYPAPGDSGTTEYLVKTYTI